MAISDPKVVTSAKELVVPDFNKKEIIKIVDEHLAESKLIFKGKFDEYGKFQIDPEILSGGLYLFTYSNCYAFVPITKEALDYVKVGASIKVAIPCVYKSDGSFRPGTLMIYYMMDQYLVKIIDGAGSTVVNDLELSIYKTNLF